MGEIGEKECGKADEKCGGESRGEGEKEGEKEWGK